MPSDWYQQGIWVLAACLAAVVSYAELIYSLRRIPSPQTCFFVACRLVIDAGAASIMFAVIVEFFEGLPWFKPAWAVLLSGLCGPALLRAQLALLGSGQEERSIGPANVFRRIRSTIDSLILDIDIVSVDRWMNSSVVPALEEFDRVELCSRISTYFRAKYRAKKAEELVQQLERISGTGTGLDEDERRAIVHFVFVHDGKRLIRSIARAAKPAQGP